MKKMIFLTLLGSSFLFGHTLTVNIIDIENNRGQILIGLYNQEEGFRETNMTYKKGVLTTLDDKNVTYHFMDIPYGEYAISLFHDENNNGELDSNFIGIPQEGYGFSNNVRPVLRPASFKEAKFMLNSDLNITIKMGY